jgi:hypothetical protein
MAPSALSVVSSTVVWDIGTIKRLALGLVKDRIGQVVRCLILADIVSFDLDPDIAAGYLANQNVRAAALPPSQLSSPEHSSTTCELHDAGCGVSWFSCFSNACSSSAEEVAPGRAGRNRTWLWKKTIAVLLPLPESHPPQLLLQHVGHSNHHYFLSSVLQLLNSITQ